MANSRTHTGDASGVDLTVPVSVNTPASGDGRSAASIQQAIEPLSDTVEALRIDGGNAIFGDGSDGAAAFDGSTAVTGCSRSGSVYTATRDLFFTDAIFSANVTLKMAGFRLYVSGTLDTHAANVTIHVDGGAGSSVTAGTAGGNGGVLATSGAGAAGGGNGGASASVSACLGGAGGTGGTGAGGGSPGTSTATAVTAAQGNIRVPGSIWTGMLFGASGVTVVNGGAGGGGGQGSGGGTNGGYGGGGGGVLLICARTIRFAASTVLRAAGGAGGSASGASAGGGGGGGGGAVILLYRNKYTGSTAPASVVSAPAGAAGAPGAGGGTPSAASAGSTIVVKV